MILYHDRKHRKLQERAHQANLAVRDLSERIRECRRELQDRELHRRTDGRPLSDDEQQRFDEKARPVRNDLAFYEEELQAAQREHDAVVEIATRTREHLDELQRAHRVVEPDPEAEAPKPLDRARGDKELAKVREKIRAALTRRDAVAEAPLPAADAQRRVDELLNGAAASCGAANVIASQALSPDHAITLDALAPQALNGYKLDIVPVLAWANLEALRAALHAEIDRRADPDQALAADDRTAQLEQLDAELAELGREEEKIVARMEATGEAVERRPEADPAIVLEIREVESARDEPGANPPQAPKFSPHRREGEPVTRVVSGTADAGGA